jgi:integrase
MSRFFNEARGVWCISLVVNGRRAYRRLPKGATAGDAKQLEADLRAALGRKRAPTIPGDPPLLDLLAAYIDRANQTLRSPDTAAHHARRAAPWAEKYKASEADQCAAHMVMDMTGHYAPATINRSLGAIKSALSHAWRERLIPDNYGARIQRLPEHNERHAYPSIEAVKAIADHCGEQARAAIWMALLTGARRGEVCQIDPARHIHGDRLDIPASHTKTLRVRSLPIIAPMRPWLKYFPLQITVSGVNSAFRRARVKAGYPTVRFHDLRHACASLLIEAGEDLYAVGEVLGHTNVQTTRRYAHLQLDRKRTAMDKVGEAVGEIAARIAAK